MEQTSTNEQTEEITWKGLFRKARLEGKVIDVIPVYEFTDEFGKKNKYATVTGKRFLGYDKNGMPITESFTTGRYGITITDAEGKTYQFADYGKLPRVEGKIQKQGVN